MKLLSIIIFTSVVFVNTMYSEYSHYGSRTAPSTRASQEDIESKKRGEFYRGSPTALTRSVEHAKHSSDPAKSTGQ